jgi:hypothetical protein
MPDDLQQSGSDQTETTTAIDSSSAPSEGFTQDQTPSTSQQDSGQDSGQDSSPIPEGDQAPVSAALDAFAAAKEQPVRIYDGLEQDEIRLFKDMSTPAYAKLYPLYLEHKKLKETHETDKQKYETEINALRGQSSFDQEGAWKLTPEYDQLSSTVQRLGAEANHWENQLAAIEAGEPFTPIVLDAQGNPVLGQSQTASPMDKVKVMSALQRAHALHGQFAQNLQQYEGNYKSQHQNYLSGLQNARKTIFNGADLTKLEKAAATKLELFPAYVRGKPEVKLLAEALVLVDGFKALLNQKTQTTTTKTIQNKIASAAGPTAETIQSGAGGEAKVGDAMKQFADMRAKGLA